MFLSSAVWHKEIYAVDPSLLSGSFPDSNPQKENVCVYMQVTYVSVFQVLLFHNLTLISSSLPLPFLLALPKRFWHYTG